MMANGPIGIFDSGVGGTSVWREIHKLMPQEDTIYLADSKNAPYGEKTKEEIRSLSSKNTRFLLDKGCKLIVVACNTATTNTITFLRNTYSVPFIGIEPAIKPAALQTHAKKVGVLATKGTLASDLFHSTAQNHAAGIEIIVQEGVGLVEQIEAGKIDSMETRSLLQQLLNPMVAKGIDSLVLGCTHYPYLLPILKELLPANIKIIDSGEAVARQTHSILKREHILRSKNANVKCLFYSNANVDILKIFLKDVPQGVEVGYMDF